LRWLDERAPDVGVLHEAVAERDARLLGVADGRRGAGLRHRDDEVGLDRRRTRELAADLLAHAEDALLGDRGVGSREVDVLENAALGLGRREARTAQAVLVDRDELAGLDLADV